MAPKSSAGAPSVTLSIQGLTSSGDGVARLADGRVAFVRGALPGDEVEARITESKERLVNADAVRVLTPSPQRVTSTCLRERCGGCALRDFDVTAQREVKVDQVLQAMTRIGKLDAAPVFRGMMHGAAWRYRHRARFHARHDGQWRLGYHARGSHDLVDLTECPILWPELEAAARDLAAWLAPQPKSLRVREVELAYSRRDGRAVAAFMAAEQVRDGPFDNGVLRYDHAGDFTLRFSAGVFTQANPEMNDQLVAAVLQAVRGERVLELHSGIGNFSLPLAVAGHVVRAVEENPASSALAKENANGFSVVTVTASDRAAVADADRYDTVLLDPPRIGARDVASRLAARGPSRVVYVSCDPATLARDLRLLVDGGYRLDALSTFDLFPQTPHVESLAVLTR
ncbi:MAG: class I SAM-dependent RNA methyltransferase [Myxococcota bacterium]